ncbi:TlpA family protein disulfide reductase [Amycolatopsis sp. NPDC003865]
MTHTRRWVLVTVVLVLASAVALWPRDGHEQGGATAPSGQAPSRVVPDLAQARAEAALRPCPRPVPRAAASAPLKDVKGDCLGDGSVVDLGAALAGKPALINVWATWCQPCREELPVLDAYSMSTGAVPVLGVQVQSEPADGLDLLAYLGVRFPSVHDTEGTIRRALQLPAFLPVSYVVLPEGAVRRVDPPTPFRSPEEVRRTVDRYLTAGPTGGNG